MGLMPASPRERLLPLALEEALEQRCAVMMEYLDARQNRTHRLVEPLTVRRRGGELVMVAWCHMRNDRRTFKLDRVVQMSRAEKPAAAPQPAVQIVPPMAEPAAPTIVDEPCPPIEIAPAMIEVPAMIQVPPEASLALEPSPC